MAFAGIASSAGTTISGIVELIRTFREEVLGQHMFLRVEEVREAAYWWTIEYNEERPHDGLGDRPGIRA